MENLEKNIKNSENITKKEEIVCDDGTILEYDWDEKGDEVKRFFIKDKDGKILKFLDLELNDIDLLKEYHLDMFKDKFLKAGIVLTESDLSKISQELNKKLINDAFAELDEEIKEDIEIEN